MRTALAIICVSLIMILIVGARGSFPELGGTFLMGSIIRLRVV